VSCFINWRLAATAAERGGIDRIATVCCLLKRANGKEGSSSASSLDRAERLSHVLVEERFLQTCLNTVPLQVRDVGNSIISRHGYHDGSGRCLQCMPYKRVARRHIKVCKEDVKIPDAVDTSYCRSQVIGLEYPVTVAA
jgi:hypothetical protein